MANCIKCLNNIDGNTISYDCDICRGKLHDVCLGLTSTEERVLPLKKRRLKIVCDACLIGMEKMTGFIQAFEIMKNDMKKVKDFMEKLQQKQINENGIREQHNELDEKVSVIRNEITMLKESNIQLVHLLCKDVPHFTSSPSSNVTTAPKISFAEKVINSGTNKNLAQPKSVSDKIDIIVHPKKVSKPTTPVTSVTQEPVWKKKTYLKRGKSQVGTHNGEDSDTSDKFESGNSKKIWLFIANVKDGVTQETIQKYVSKRCNAIINDVYVKPLDVYKKKQENNCFMIGVDPTFHRQVYECSFWPKGITFDRFDFKKGRRFLDNPRFSGPKDSDKQLENGTINKPHPSSPIQPQDFYQTIMPTQPISI